MGRAWAMLLVGAVAVGAGCSQSAFEDSSAAGGGGSAGGSPESSGGVGGGSAGGGTPSGWVEVPGPPAGANESIVAAWSAGTDDLFFVANSNDNNGVLGTTVPWSSRILRWTAADGWREELVIAPASSPAVAVSGSGPDDVWTAGNGHIFHRDAQGWQMVSDGEWSPEVGTAAAQSFVGVAARAADDVWFAAQSFLLHRTAAGWSAYVIGGSAYVARWFDLLWLGRGGDVWVAGSTDQIGNTMDPPFVARYGDGMLLAEPVGLYLSPVAAAWPTSDGGFWYTAPSYHHEVNGRDTLTPLCHYAGGTTVDGIASTGSAVPNIRSLWGRADDDGWAAGDWSNTRPALFHYDGAAWTAVADAPSADSSFVLVTGDAQSTWVVTDGPRFYRRTLTSR